MQNKDSPSLTEVLKKSRPSMSEVVDPISGETIEIFSDPQVEAEIQALADEFPVQVRDRAVVFCREFLKCFYDNRQDVIPQIIKEMNSDPWRVTEQYIDQFQYLVQEAAAVGFPSLHEPFGETRQQRIVSDTHRSAYDARNIYALRVYMADLLFEITQVRIKETKSLLKKRDMNNPVLQQHILNNPLSINEEIAAAWGSLPTINEGHVSKVLPEPKVRYHRHKVPIYIPDIGVAKNTLSIAGSIFQRPRRTDRNGTYQIMGSMNQEKALELFRDIDESNDDEVRYRKRVESSFGMSYESARKLIKNEFDHDN